MLYIYTVLSKIIWHDKNVKGDLSRSWFSFGSNDNKDSIKDKIRDLERDLRSIEYDYYKACDELDRAEREGDSISERRWDDYAYNLKCKKEDLEYEIRDLERSL